MKESERLKAAKALISDEKNWMQGNYADDPHDFNKSCKFCSLGAIFKVRGEGYLAADTNSTSHYLRCAIRGSIPTYNDTHTHAEVMQMFDKAIELALVDEGDAK